MHVIIATYMHVSNLRTSRANLSMNLKAVMLYIYTVVTVGSYR